MRLQLTTRRARAAAGAAALLVAAASVAAAAGPGPERVGARVDVYTDGLITVVSPSAAGSAVLPGGVRVEAAYAVDVLSGATRTLTVDAVSSATHFEEERHEAHGAVTVEVAPYTTMGAAYSLSIEPDYATHAVSASFAREVLERMATLTLAYRVNVESFGVAHDPGPRESLLGHALDLSWSQILGPGTVLTGLASAHVAYCGDTLGCHAGAYRWVGVYAGGAEPKDVIALRERHPPQRVRGAAALRLVQSLGGGFALHAGYRFYGDSWHILGHTLDAALAASLFAERLVLRAETRFTWQSAASFYRDRYVADEATGALPAYRSADREMAGLWDVMAGLRGEWSIDGGELLRQLRINLRLAHIWYRYEAYSELPHREAWLVGAGVSAEF